MRPVALKALAGSEVVVHAGDIGSPEVLAALTRIAPVVAVRGNNDRGPWSETIPATAVVRVGAARLYVLHDRNELDVDPAGEGFQAIITGHSHRPSIERRDDVLYLNPGSAGPRRFSLPTCIARLHVHDSEIEAEIVHLDV
jgi:putative phosphoesterase